ncbi:integrase core domain protein [Streptococcus vestibularis ATCC 49124]|uniref:Integrase core domain protein n=1 Tax=Streptococcus vestibularis ATCC 49124 TaxID=889206 RepID=A0ABP2KNZ6_STRVE|nr:integrase core domain protein [Streptococcus vestibularis ATCC 49124]
MDLVTSALGERASVYFDNKFSRPFFTDVIKEMENDGIEECLCMILEPHYSYYSDMGYEKFLASDIEASINQWLSQVPSHLFKSITFDCGKEFSNWKSISNAHDIDIFFADPGCPGQRGLNEHSNGLLRRNGLPKQMDFTNISQNYLSATADKRNRLPRKSLNYQTPYQVFLSYMKNLT